jgi:hypothetical protein
VVVVVVLHHVPGGQALGPFQWQAPEVCKEITAAATNQAATLATTPSDVYMLGAYALSSALCCMLDAAPLKPELFCLLVMRDRFAIRWSAV